MAQEKKMSNEENTVVTGFLPALLVGGPPNAGKSVLTYNLSQELRRREIPHYVFRASPDGEGDWYHEGDAVTVRQLRIEAKGDWSDEFRQLVCHDLQRRLVPLIVDIGGCPNDKDSCIFQACTHSLLLLRADKEEKSQTWRQFTARYGLTPLAELASQLEGDPILTAREPVLTGILTDLQRGQAIKGRLFEVLANRVCKLFGSYTEDELEKLHMDLVKGETVIHLPQWLARLAPDQDEWTTNQLQRLLTEISGQTPYRVYGRAPNWVYGALALHGGALQPFYQFDPRHGWVEPPVLQASASLQQKQRLILLDERTSEKAWMLKVRLQPPSYLDYTETDQLIFPEAPPEHGVIINGKLPLWLFTALARFYASRNAPWIAFNYASENRAFVVFSLAATPAIGDRVLLPV
jgi:CRISPR-associated protein Csx3